jgi:hypothetical protein
LVVVAQQSNLVSHFTGVANFPAPSSFSVWLEVGFLFERGSNRVELGRDTINGQKSLSTIQSTLNLKKGDQVSLRIFYLSLAGLLCMTAYTTPFILYGLDAVRGGHCRVTLTILFILLLINDRVK